MRKNIWIINHYAINHYFNEGGRHFWFAENLKKKGYNPTVICANTRHNNDQIIDVGDKIYIKKYLNNIPYVFVEASTYKKNGLSRIKNMYTFYKNLLKFYKKYLKGCQKPDVIIASSVHPLTLVAGLKIAKKLDIPCICEVRDLWPESIVAYGSLKRTSPLAKVLYQGEKWIYKNADEIVMTWEGGSDYIKDRGWENQIDLKKVHHINNGIVIDDFDYNLREYVVNDVDLDDPNYKNFIYTGSIRRVNNLGLLLDVAKIIQDKNIKDIRFIIYGSGDEEEGLKESCKIEGISNVIFKGRVEKKYIPSIISRSYANLLHNSSTSLDKYGQSQNKMFEYLAAGKPIIQTYTTGYSIIDKYSCGKSAKEQNANEVADIIINMANNEEKTFEMARNAREAAFSFDFNNLTEKLITIIEKN